MGRTGGRGTKAGVSYEAKKEESRFAEEQAETARREREHEGMRVNDERALRRQRALNDTTERILARFFPEE